MEEPRVIEKGESATNLLKEQQISVSIHFSKHSIV